MKTFVALDFHHCSSSQLLKADLQSVLRSLSGLMFVRQIDVIPYELLTLSSRRI